MKNARNEDFDNEYEGITSETKFSATEQTTELSERLERKGEWFKHWIITEMRGRLEGVSGVIVFEGSMDSMNYFITENTTFWW